MSFPHERESRAQPRIWKPLGPVAYNAIAIVPDPVAHDLHFCECIWRTVDSEASGTSAGIVGRRYYGERNLTGCEVLSGPHRPHAT